VSKVTIIVELVDNKVLQGTLSTLQAEIYALKKKFA